MTDLLRDLRYAVRRLTSTPTTTVLALTSLALGIGINTTIFSYLDRALLRPLPVAAPDELVRVYTTTGDFTYGAHSQPGFRDLQEAGEVFEAVAAERFVELNLRAGDGQAQQVWGLLVSGNYFDALGLQPAAGRLIAPGDDVTSAGHPLAVLAHETWQRRFGGDVDVAGRRIAINGHPFTVVGVAPRSFTGSVTGLAPEVFLPLAMQSQAIPGSERSDNRAARWLGVIARLRSGVAVEQARSALSSLAHGLAENYPDTDQGLGFNVIPLRQDNLPFQLRDRTSWLLGLLMGLAGVVLLIACANLANLLLARAAASRTDMSVRLAIGAGRQRLIRQLMIESLLLAMAAGALGLFVAFLAMGIVAGVQVPGGLPVETRAGLDLRVLAFTILVSLAAALTFGILPALRATRADLVPALKREEPAVVGRRLSLRSALVVAQVALSLVLLVTAGLFIRSLWSTLSIDAGFDAERVLLGNLNPGLSGYDEERGRALYRQLADRLDAQAAIEAVAFADSVPLEPGGEQQIRIEIVGYEPRGGQGHPVIDFNVITPGYFRTLGIPILAGGEFGEHQGDEPWVAVVNESLARQYWPGQEAVGRRMLVAGAIPVEVVGVVGDVRHGSLSEPPAPFLYLSALQHYQSSMVLHVRTSVDPLSLAPVVRRELQALDPNLSLGGVETMREHVVASMLPMRLATGLLGAFGLLALVLAVIGIYGVMSYNVRQRHRELGIRIAIGADRRDIFGLVLRHGLALVVAGVVLGLSASVLAARVLSGAVIEVPAVDSATVVVVCAVFLGVATLATLVPATRASRTEPMTILRRE
jgi:predicted permease